MLRHKGFSAINIAGLALGLAVSILIFMHVSHELSYDRFHKNAAQIYRIAVDSKISGRHLNVAVSSGAWAKAMVEELPEVKNAVRLDHTNSAMLLGYGDKKIYQKDILFADSTFFDVFSYRLLEGNPQTALSRRHSMVLTESLANKLFPDESPMGKTVTWNQNQKYTITGVVQDSPGNSHLSFELILSFSSLYESPERQELENWTIFSIYTYLLLEEGTNPKALEKKFRTLLEKHIGENLEEHGVKIQPYLQPLTDIHLHSNLMAELSTNSHMMYVYIFVAIALFILLIACMNFMNLSTARSANRAREVGIRKVLGSTRAMLIKQFIGESVLLSFFALVLALLFVEIFIEPFNKIAGKDFSIEYLLQWEFIVGMLALTLIVGIVSGSYPAFYLSAFRPVNVIKGQIHTGRRGKLFRSALVVIQFAISISLLICTGLIYKQLLFVQEKRLGFQRDNVLVIPLRNERLQKKHPVFKEKFLQTKGVNAVSATSSYPGSNIDARTYLPEGKTDREHWLIFNIRSDYNYIKTLNMKLLQGRCFSPDTPSDSDKVIINQTLAQRLGWQKPLGKTLKQDLGDTIIHFEVVGLVEDFHYFSLRDKIEPFILQLGNKPTVLLLNIESQNIDQTMQRIASRWEEVANDIPFDYFFLDHSFDKFYRSEKRIGKIFMYFTLFAVFIASLGLSGLASFTGEQRTKEIGIRKVLGASAMNILLLLSKDFVRWVLIANLIAWPLAYYGISKWFESFAYQTSLSGWVFVAAACAALLVAQLTINLHALRLAALSPARALKQQ